MRHKFLVLPVKKWLKSVHIYVTYRKNKIGLPFFWTTLYVPRLGPNLLAPKTQDLASLLSVIFKKWLSISCVYD